MKYRGGFAQAWAGLGPPCALLTAAPHTQSLGSPALDTVCIHEQQFVLWPHTF